MKALRHKGFGRIFGSSGTAPRAGQAVPFRFWGEFFFRQATQLRLAAADYSQGSGAGFRATRRAAERPTTIANSLINTIITQ